MTVMANFKRFRGSGRGVILSEPLWCGNWDGVSWKKSTHSQDIWQIRVSGGFEVTSEWPFLHCFRISPSCPPPMRSGRSTRWFQHVGSGSPLPHPLSFVINTLRGSACKQQKPQPTKVSCLNFTRTFWVVLEVGRRSAQRWVIIVREQAYLYGGSQTNWQPHNAEVM